MLKNLLLFLTVCIACAPNVWIFEANDYQCKCKRTTKEEIEYFKSEIRRLGKYRTRLLMPSYSEEKQKKWPQISFEKLDYKSDDDVEAFYTNYLDYLGGLLSNLCKNYNVLQDLHSVLRSLKKENIFKTCFKHEKQNLEEVEGRINEVVEKISLLRDVVFRTTFEDKLFQKTKALINTEVDLIRKKVEENESQCSDLVFVDSWVKAEAAEKIKKIILGDILPEVYIKNFEDVVEESKDFIRNIVEQWDELEDDYEIDEPIVIGLKRKRQ